MAAAVVSANYEIAHIAQHFPNCIKSCVGFKIRFEYQTQILTDKPYAINGGFPFAIGTTFYYPLKITFTAATRVVEEEYQYPRDMGLNIKSESNTITHPRVQAGHISLK